MGMYTELVLACELKRDVPQEVLDVLRFMCVWQGGSRQPPEHLPDHPLFRMSHWEYVLRSGSFYFPGETNSTLRVFEPTNTWYLTARSNLKNYGSEIEYFLQWLAPYSETEGFVGYYRYEESPHPSLIYFAEGKAARQHITGEGQVYLWNLDEYLEDDEDEDSEPDESAPDLEEGE